MKTLTLNLLNPLLMPCWSLFFIPEHFSMKLGINCLIYIYIYKYLSIFLIRWFVCEDPIGQLPNEKDSLKYFYSTVTFKLSFKRITKKKMVFTIYDSIHLFFRFCFLTIIDVSTSEFCLTSVFSVDLVKCLSLRKGRYLQSVSLVWCTCLSLTIEACIELL